MPRLHCGFWTAPIVADEDVENSEAAQLAQKHEHSLEKCGDRERVRANIGHNKAEDMEGVKDDSGTVRLGYYVTAS